jgi:hypothetical protein
VQFDAGNDGRALLYDAEGEYSGGVPDCAIIIKHDPPKPPTLSQTRLWVPAWQNPAAASTTIRKNEDGTVSWGHAIRTVLYWIDAHRLSQVLTSFNSARGQISQAGAGVVLISVDTSRVSLGDYPLISHTCHVAGPSVYPCPEHPHRGRGPMGDVIEVREREDVLFHDSFRPCQIIRNPHFPGIDRIIIHNQPTAVT